MQNYALQITVSQSSTESDEDFQEAVRQSLSCWYVYSLSVIIVIVFFCMYSSRVTYLMTVNTLAVIVRTIVVGTAELPTLQSCVKTYQYPVLNSTQHCVYVSVSEWKAQLRELQLSIDSESSPPTANMINVLRGNVRDGFGRALQRSRFNPLKKLDIRFVDVDNNTEGAVDSGGPTREFFRLLLVEIFSSSIFSGDDNIKMLELSTAG